MISLKRDVLRLVFLVGLWIAHAFLPTPTSAESFDCEGCIGGCSAHNPDYACCGPSWPHEWDACEPGEGGCNLGMYCGE